MKIKNVVDYEGLYAVTDEGVVFSLKSGNEIKSRLNTQGYFYVQLCKEGKSSEHSVHRIVYEAFNGKKSDNLVIDHIDGNRLNNNLTNLRKLTTRENTARAKVSKYGRGVRLFEKINKFGASIQIENVNYFLGTFLTIEEARQAYNTALVNYERDGIKPFKRDRSVKFCKHCRQEKPINEFYYIKSHGHTCLCKECQKAVMKEYRRKKKLLRVLNA